MTQAMFRFAAAVQPKHEHLWDAMRLETCTVVDVGARFGGDARWLHLGDRLRLIGFEPDLEECSRLNQALPDPRSMFLPNALAERTLQITIHVCRNPGNSSRYRPQRALLSRFPNVERFDIVEEVEVTARTLDDALEDRAPIDFVKLDTQGSEANIIAGAHKRLDEAFGVEVEIEFSALYEGQPLFADVDRALRALGFTLFDLRPCYWKRESKPSRGAGQLMWGDALYLRDPIASGVMPLNPAAALAISLIYGKFDFAIELAAFFARHGAYGPGEYERIAPLLRGVAAGTSVGRFRGAGRLFTFLRRITDRYHEAHWARYEQWRF
jgi:FkbM family methyltransferase